MVIQLVCKVCGKDIDDFIYESFNGKCGECYNPSVYLSRADYIGYGKGWMVNPEFVRKCR